MGIQEGSSRAEFDANLASLRERLEFEQARYRSLQLHAAQPGTQVDTLTQSLSSLSETLEELQVSTEELRVQNESLVRTETLLEAERQRYAALFQLAPEPIVVTDEHGVIREMNHAAGNLLGVDEIHVEGKPLVVFVAESERRRFRALTLKVVNTGSPHVCELIVMPRKRGPFSVRATVAPLHVAGETMLYWSLRDEQLERRAQLAEERLEQTRQEQVRAAELAARIRFLDQTSSVLAGGFDSAAVLQRLTEAVTAEVADCCLIVAEGEQGRLVQYSSVRADCMEQMHTLRARYGLEEASNTLVETVLSTGKPQFLPIIPDQIAASGESIPTLLTQLGPRYGLLVPITALGTRLGVMVWLTRSARFGGEEYRLAQELATRTASALQNARLFENTHRANREKADFLAVVSHELRTPLTSVIGYLELLLSDDFSADDERRRVFLERVRMSAWQQLDLVEEILEHARLESVPQSIMFEPVNATALLNEVLEFMIPAAQQKKLDLHYSVPNDLRIESSTGKLRQVLINLLSNALKFTERGTVTLRAQQLGDELEISISDTGAGIDAASLKRIFDPFWRGRAGMTEPRGTGLGLSIARRLVHLMNGRIGVESEIDSGTTFHVWLPIHQKQEIH